MALHSAFNTKGYDQLDVIEQKSSGKSFTYQAGEGHKLTQSNDFGIGIRAVVKGKVGHAYANRYEDLPQTVKRAIKLAKYSNISIKLGKYSYKKPAKIYDSKLANQDFLGQLKEIIASTRGEKCSILSAENSAGKSSVHYLNSEGVDVEEKSTEFSVFWDLEHKGEPCSYGIESTHFVKDFSKDLARTCRFAKLRHKKIDVKTGPEHVVLYHHVLPGLLTYGLLPTFSAKTVQQGKSKLAESVGKKVFSSKLSIADDGLLSGGLASGAFDAEGVPCQRTELIKNGVLKGFLYDLARAKGEKASTGNGFRSYSSVADVAPTNFVVAKGRGDLVKNVDKGLLLYSALNVHSTDYISGDFSVGACPAFVIKNGELIGTAKKAMLSGNIYDLLKQVKSVGGDQVSQVGGVFGGSTIVSPSILSECLVIGE